MPVISKRVVKVSARQQVYEILLSEITAGEMPPGTRLEPVRALAERFGTSVRTVHQGLTALEEKGLLIKRHGSGTFVAERDAEFTLNDTVVLCMEITGHVFSDLCRMIQHELHAQSQIPVCLDLNHPDFERMLRRTSLSNAGCFVIHGNRYFPFQLLQTKPFAGKALIGILDWETDQLTGLAHRVIVDHTEGGRMAARHLWAAGHRHALMAGNGDMLWTVEHEAGRHPHSGSGFLETWQQAGGRWQPSVAREAGDAVTGKEADDLLALLTGPAAPTAIHALMDTNAVWIQRVLAARAPALLGRIAIVGYGNTPWSQASNPAFSSVDWNLAEVVKATGRIIMEVQAGQQIPPAIVHVTPVLVAR